MNYQELADELLDTFTPFAFKCPCEGADASCRQTLDSEAEQIRYYYLIRIANYIANKG